MKTQTLTVLFCMLALTASARAGEMCQGPAGEQTKIDLTNPACVDAADGARATYGKAYNLVMKQAVKSTKKNVGYLKDIVSDFGADNLAKMHKFTAAVKSIDLRTDLSAEEKQSSKQILRAKLEKDIEKISKKFDSRYSDISCPLFDPSDDHNRGCNLHTGIFGNQNLATPSFGRLVFSTGGANGSFGFTVCMFKRLDDEDVSSELMFHDSREWLEGNYHEHKDTLHYLPVSVCSSVDLTGAMPVFSSTTPKEALANLDTDYTIGTFRHQGNHASPFYRQSADAYVLSKMPQFCMKPCAPPIAKTTETKSEPVKTVAPAATVDATAPAQAGSDTSKTVAE